VPECATNAYGEICTSYWKFCQSQRPRSLRRRTAVERLLGSFVRIPPGAWMFVLYIVCVVRYKSLRRADPSSRGVLPTVMCAWVWSSDNKNPPRLLWTGRQRREGLQNENIGTPFVLGKQSLPSFVTNNRCTPVKNTFGWSAVVFCAFEIIQLLSASAVHKFDFMFAIKGTLKKGDQLKGHAVFLTGLICFSPPSSCCAGQLHSLE
jgi:hypothetical protein